MVRTYTSESFGGGNTEVVEKIGKFMVKESMKRSENADFYSKEDMQRTKANIDAFGPLATEDLTSDNNTGLYTTAIADFIERKLRPTLVAEGLIKRMRIDNRGTSAIKIPVSALVTAAALPDSGAVTYASGVDHTSVTITLGWVYAAQKITMELIQQSNVDLIQEQLFELGDAIARKIDSDIIASMVTATPSNDANANYTALGASQNLTYALLVEGIRDALINNAMIDSILVNPTNWAVLMKDTDVKTALGFNSTAPGTIYPQVINLFGMKLLMSNQVGANDTFLVDSGRTGYFVEASGVQVFNDRVSGSLADEVIAAKNYGVAIVQPQSVFRLKDNTA